MFEHPAPSAGFTAAPNAERAAHGNTLPVLVASLSLFLSTAVLLTVMTMSARAAELF
jgi:hypothetical protein